MAPEYGATMGFFPVDERDARLPAALGPPAKDSSKLVETVRRRNRACWRDRRTPVV
jgi:aconitase A